MRLLKCFILSVFVVTTVQAQTEMPLYSSVPGSKPYRDREKSVVSGGILRISNVSTPTLTIYKPAIPSDKRTAVVICPGGGYSILASQHEGIDVAKLFNEWGITAFVLKYRLPDDTIMVDKKIGPLQDAQRAVQLVKERASEWGIDSSRVGIMGFSAGGHLAASASTHFAQPFIDNPKGISLRPAFSILIYPVISFTDSLTHMGSRNNLIGKTPSAADTKYYSNELQVTAQTPPAFLVHSGDDNTVKVENSIRYYEALVKNKVLAELHLYPKGGHGYGMNNRTTIDRWTDRLKNWMTNNGYL